ncbi:LOW QUALITY PROTEIN: CCR4-NOT transcription complex subunit 9-like [Argopecten irradians]|uniref:LOW QUALITY PROTEIN: CCR4-NOT transcription complex subunit 9-like n=1 Tax=Argopecten irradians TaxID=31199 RepID=UPI00371FA9B9
MMNTTGGQGPAGPTVSGPPVMSQVDRVPAVMSQVDREKIYLWIVELTGPDTRENALQELSKKREVVPDLAPMLWHSFGTVAALLQEIVNIYPAINPPHLTVCHKQDIFFRSHHSNYSCYPFLHTVSKTRPFEYLRITRLGVIGALVKGKMVLHLSKEPSARLLKHVVRCYLRLSDNPRAKEALRQCLPDQLKDATFSPCLKDDNSTKRWLLQLQQNLDTPMTVPDPRSMPLHPQ